MVAFWMLEVCLWRLTLCAGAEGHNTGHNDDLTVQLVTGPSGVCLGGSEVIPALEGVGAIRILGHGRNRSGPFTCCLRNRQVARWPAGKPQPEFVACRSAHGRWGSAADR